MIKPLGDRVLLVKEAEKTQTDSGIYIPQGAIDRPAIATVEAVGLEVTNNDEILVGDRVLYKEYSVTTVTMDKVEYLLIKEEDILAVVTEE